MRQTHLNDAAEKDARSEGEGDADEVEQKGFGHDPREQKQRHRHALGPLRKRNHLEGGGAKILRPSVSPRDV